MSRSLTTTDAEDFGITLGDALKGVLETAGDVFTDRPEFIRSDEPRNPLSSAVREVSRYNCRAWARADKSNFSTRVNLGNATLCNPYLEDIGELPPSGSITNDPPFEGGQCAGISYIVRRQYSGFGGKEDQPGFTTEITGVTGPVTALSPTEYTFDCDGSLRSFTLSVTGANGTKSVPIILGCSGGGGYVYRYWLVRQDGQPDTCGDPPSDPQIEPPGVPTLPPLDPTVPFDVPGFGPVDWDIDFDPSGNPTISFPDLGVDIPIEIGKGSEGESEGSPANPEPNAPIEGTPTETPVGGNGGELDAPEAPEAPEGKKYRCIGYDWLIYNFPSGDSRIPGTDRVSPTVLGNLQLKLRVGDETIRSDNLRLYSSKGVMVTPDESLECLGAYWAKNSSYSLRLTPIFKLYDTPGD